MTVRRESDTLIRNLTTCCYCSQDVFHLVRTEMTQSSLQPQLRSPQPSTSSAIGLFPSTSRNSSKVDTH